MRSVRAGWRRCSTPPTASTSGERDRAEGRVARHVTEADSLEFRGDAGGIRTFAWADLLAQLGRPQEAVSVFGRLDSVDVYVTNPALHVRSWAERAVQYQQLGDTDSAIAFYERFIDAWRDGDEPIQPLVDRARSALAALRGGLQPERR